MNALGPSLAPYVRSSRSLKKLVTPVAHWYANLMGYRRMGLKYDDLRASFILAPAYRSPFFLFEKQKWKSCLKYRGYVALELVFLLDRENVP